MLSAITQFFDLWVILFVVGGSFWGMVAGSLPGISASMALILILPFTFNMTPIQSIALLISTYVGSMCGGHISAVLMRTPGTPSAAATVFDGYPLAKQGKAGRAIAIAILASSFGGILSGIFLGFLSPMLARWALNFQSAEFFALALLGLSCTASIGAKSWSKALLSATLGILVGTVGMDPISGAQRFMFGNFALSEGISFIPVMIGTFALAEVYRNVVANAQNPNKKKEKAESIKMDMVGPRHILQYPVTYIKSAVIGLCIGIIPAAGASIASMVSYGEAKRSSKNPELFGHGAEEGIIASEASDSAAVGGTLIPTLTLGIPGGPVAAIILVSLTMHGIVPGPALIQNNPDAFFGILWTIMFASMMLFVWGMVITKQFSKIMDIPYPILGSLILAFGLVGAFTLRASTLDLMIMFIFSFVGIAFDKFGFSVPAFVLGLVLGPLAEVGFRRQLIVTGGDFSTFVTRPVSLVVLLFAIGSFIWAFVGDKVKAKYKKG